MVLDQAACGDFEHISRLEWLETNGLGGFASSTVAGINTRRYHGLLTASLRPPVERYLLLSKVEETLIVRGERFDLSSNFYPGAVHPQGWRFLKHFRARPYPVFVYSAGGVEVEKRIFMPHGENTVVIEWQFDGGACELEVRPLIAFRDYHSTTHANASLNPDLTSAGGVVRIQPYGDLPALYIGHSANRQEPGPGWYYNFEYPVERERGLDSREDLYCPAVLHYSLEQSGPHSATLIASLAPRPASDAPGLRRKEERRRAAVSANTRGGEPVVAALTTAAAQYIVSRGDLKTVIAGYHWFSDWGRDTMIALPGLALATGQVDVARDILLAFSRHIDQGMLPNRFPDSGETPEYNTVDASLWFFEAARAYAQYTGDYAFIRDHLYPVLKDMVNWHLFGTRYGIRADQDGLLCAGVPGAQLTWMDAKIGDWVVTPRHGKPVEIQALWYNALVSLADFAAVFNDGDSELILRHLANRARISFNSQFWCEKNSCFYDVVNGNAKDASIRPNQVIALSLAHTMPPPDRARAALATIERELLTPKGLRTLAPSDPAYRGRYEGPPHERDAVYHQGTVWPWLLGRFVTAYVKAHGRSSVVREKARRFLEPLCAELTTGCIGQIDEIYDGDAPHTGRGCCAQAWSVAEALRALAEDVLQETPHPALAVAGAAS